MAPRFYGPNQPTTLGILRMCDTTHSFLLLGAHTLEKWSDRRKTIQLIIVTLAAIVPDGDSGLGPHYFDLPVERVSHF